MDCTASFDQAMYYAFTLTLIVPLILGVLAGIAWGARQFWQHWRNGTR